MFTVKALPEFKTWLAGLPDEVRGPITARLDRLALGLPGDVQPVGAGVSELRIHVGKGWRVYFVQRGPVVVVVLAGGAKSTQKRDIKRALALAAWVDEQEKQARKAKSEEKQPLSEQPS